MTPEQIARLSLEIGREVTELVQRRLAEAAKWPPPPRNTDGEEWPAPGVYESDGHRMRLETGEKKLDLNAIYARPVHEDDQPVGTFGYGKYRTLEEMDRDRHKHGGIPTAAHLDRNPDDDIVALSPAQRWQADVQRDAVAEDAKRVVRGQEPLQPKPPAEE